MTPPRQPSQVSRQHGAAVADAAALPIAPTASSARTLETGMPPSSRTAVDQRSVGREAREAGASGKPDDLDAAEQGAARDVDQRQKRDLVVRGMGDLGADADREAESLQEVHRLVVRGRAAAVHEIFGGAVQVLVIDGLAHGQLQKPV